jgi:C-terminal processing protease CtpA/Prc
MQRVFRPAFAFVPTLVVTLGLAAGCKPSGSVQDPFEDALHVPRPGQSVPTMDGAAASPLDEPEAEPERGTPTPGRYGGDLDDLERVIEARWAARKRHEQIDETNVDAVFADLRRKVGLATTRPELAIAVRDAMCRLGDGHLRLVDASMEARALDSGLRVQPVGGAFVVTEVDGRYADRAFAPKPGDTIVKVDGAPVGELGAKQCLRPGSTPAQREHLQAQSLGRQLRGPDESPRPKTIGVQRKGRTHQVKLDWRAPKSDTPAPCVRGSKLAGGVGRLDIDSFACPDLATFEAQLEAGLDAIGDAKDLVVDLRRNAGGDDAQAKAAAARFVRTPTTWMCFRHHDADPGAGFSDEPFSPTPGAVVAAQRLWVLTGPGCFSTCEIFASVLASQDRVTLVGAPTAGGVGNPEPYRLSRSGLEVAIPGTLYALPGTDSPIEGAGVPVDLEVHATLDDVAEGRDAVLEAVLARVAARK